MIRTERNKKRNFRGIGVSVSCGNKFNSWKSANSKWPMINHLIRGENRSSELNKDIKKEKPLI